MDNQSDEVAETNLKNLKNILVVNDLNWDNYALINKKQKKIDSENFRVHLINTRNNILDKCCRSNELYFVRHTGKNIIDIFQKLIQFIDICVIFTNSTEYLTNSDLIRSICDSENLPYVLVSEHSREIDYYSFDNPHKTFKKMINSLNFERKAIDISSFINDSEIIMYNNNYYSRITKELFLSENILFKLRSKHISIDETKKNRSIKLLYDKTTSKLEKQTRRACKEYKQLEFGNNRLNYYKTSPIKE